MYASLTQWVPAPRRAPDGEALFAIGDVHGYADELEAMQHLIAAQVTGGSAHRSTVVYLGDYVDRGPDSGRALDLLAANRTDEPNLRRIYLTGNHDQYLVEFIRPGGYIDMNFLAMWFANGGEQTLQSIGVQDYGRLVNAGRLEELGERTREALGSSRLALLDRLLFCHKAGDYLFVHAGIDPAVDLEAQERSDLLMIREPFLSAARYWRHSFCVVHGHSISRPIVLPHRIGVDAGCYWQGALCAVQIVGERLRFLGVTRKRDHRWARLLGGGGVWQWSEPTQVG